MDALPTTSPVEQQSLSGKWKAPFFTIWTGQAFSLLGSQLVQFALIWWLTKTTGSATVLATASLVGLLPQVFLAPLAGALVDRWSRRATMMIADTFVALGTVGLALLFWSGQIQVWHVYVVMFLRATAGGFHWTAMQASTSLMVPKKHLSRIQGLNQSLNGAMNIGSAPLGALLLGVLPMQGILMIDIFTALLAVIPLFFIAVPQPKRSATPENQQGEPSVWQDFKEGLKYMRGWPGMLLIALMATIINLLLNPAIALLPILVTDHFAGEALQLAWIESSWGVGVVAGGLLLSGWGGFRRQILTVLLGLGLLGGGMFLIGVVPSTVFIAVIPLMFIVGVSNPITNGPLFAILQSVVAPDMQGRVFTLLMSAASAMSPLGLIIAGPVADTLGVQTWYLAGGAVTILMGLGAFFVPAVMQIERGHPLDGRAQDREVMALSDEMKSQAVTSNPGD
ncbi:MAG: MFS transporter [Anaerolineales bacterium]|jgi:DHA3 family macrolide efflux protein-like MFS transporter